MSEANSVVKPKLAALLKKFKSVFPAALPLSLPPVRGLDDEHATELVENARVPPRKYYKVSPAE